MLLYGFVPEEFEDVPVRGKLYNMVDTKFGNKVPSVEDLGTMNLLFPGIPLEEVRCRCSLVRRGQQHNGRG